jgi:GAF domain-containing protein
MLPLLTVRESEEEIRAGADFQQELDRIYLGVEKRTAFIEEALNCLRTYAEAPAGFLCLWDEPGKNYRIILAQGQVPVTSMKGPFYPEMGLAGWVMRENRPLFLNRILPNADKTYLFSPDDPYVGFQSFVGIPVTFRDQVLGAVCLTFSHPSEWSQRFLEAIKGVGPKIGAGLTLRTHFA